MKARYGSLRFGAETMMRRITARPDTKRWAELDSFEAGWGSRTELIAELVPAHTRVLEFGAGTRQLERLLDPTCIYIPSDLVERGPDTFVVNLNQRPLPSLATIAPDVVVFAGVLEYLRRIPELATWLAAETAQCVVTYECAAGRPRSWRRLVESLRRAQSGWVNTYDEDELVAMFAAAGFDATERRTWSTPEGDERVFVFTRVEVSR
jgi:hypothetical protein